VFPYELERGFGSDALDWFEVVAAEEEAEVDELVGSEMG